MKFTTERVIYIKWYDVSLLNLEELSKITKNSDCTPANRRRGVLHTSGSIASDTLKFLPKNVGSPDNRERNRPRISRKSDVTVLCSDNSILSRTGGGGLFWGVCYLSAICREQWLWRGTSTCEFPAVSLLKGLCLLYLGSYPVEESRSFSNYVCAAPSTQPPSSVSIIQQTPPDTALSHFHPLLIVTSDFLTTISALSSHRYPRFNLSLLTDQQVSLPKLCVHFLLFCMPCAAHLSLF